MSLSELDFSNKEKKEVLRSMWLSIVTFVLLAVLISLDEILDLPHVVFGTLSTPINWMEIIIEETVCIIISVIYLKLLYDNRIKRYQSEKQLRYEHKYTLFLNDLMKHDISNMVQSVLNYMELLMKKPDFPDKYKKAVATSLYQSKRIAQLISNVRKLSYLPTCKIELRAYDFYHALINTFPLFESNFPLKNINIKYNLSKNEVIIEADDLIEDVIINVLGNAIKFDPNKDVVIDITHTLLDDNKHWKIEFKDNGPGIPDEMKEKVFNRLEQGRKDMGGLGLGLTLVKQIVERYGGKVWVEDKVKDDCSKGTNLIIIFKRGELDGKDICYR